MAMNKYKHYAFCLIFLPIILASVLTGIYFLVKKEDLQLKKTDCFNLIIGNSICDDSENRFECGFDGGDCCLGSNASKVACQICKCHLEEENIIKSPTFTTTSSTTTTTATAPLETNDYLLVFSIYPSRYQIFDLTEGKEVFTLETKLSESVQFADYGYVYIAWTNLNPVLLLCGGYGWHFATTLGLNYPVYNLEGADTKCYDSTNKKFDKRALRKGRLWPMRVKMNETHYWVFGGQDSNFDALATSEFVTETDSVPGPDLNFPLALSCAAMVDSQTVVIVAGGEVDKVETASSWMYNFRTGSWVQLQNLNVPRKRTACEIMKTQEGKVIFSVFSLFMPSEIMNGLDKDRPFQVGPILEPDEPSPFFLPNYSYQMEK